MGRRSGGGGGRPLDETIEQRVHDAILELAERQALDSATLDEIAGRAGVAKSTLYRRFGGKDRLLQWAMMRFADSAMEVPDAGTIRERLVSLVCQQVERYALDSGGELVRMAFQGLGADPAEADEVRAFARRARNEFVDLFVQAAGAGELRADLDPEVCVDLVFGAMWGRVIGLHAIGDPEEYAATVVDHVLGGIGPVGTDSRQPFQSQKS